MKGLISIYLDVFRFVAALGVFLWHAGHLPMSAGVLPVIVFNHKLVIIFFVISGYVIAASADRPDRTLANFSADRLARLSSVVIPALLLTYFLDTVGSWISPDIYANISPHWQSIRLLANLLYCQQIWFLCVNPSSNNPFWSLGYEFWYYVLFGVWLFVRRKSSKIWLSLVIGLFIGPKILLLLPAWVVGALAYHAGKKWRRSYRSSLMLFIVSGAIVLAALIFENQLKLNNDRAGMAPLYYSANYIGDNVFAAIVALNFLFCALVSKNIAKDFEKYASVKLIRWLASHTFSLYLYHLPLLLYVRAIFKYDPRHPAAVLFAMAMTLLVIAGLSKITEERYPLLRSWLRRKMEIWLHPGETPWKLRLPPKRPEPMQLAFLCNSLEPGRDGVGDYCRRLGQELEQRGHGIHLISLNDRAQVGCNAYQQNGMSFLRCGQQTPLLQRAQLALESLKRFKPDWLSLHYVCFGYHPRGLARQWNPVFTQLGATAAKRHLMFHELWIDPPPLHRWFIGKAQRMVIRNLNQCFQPDVVTTSISFHRERLASAGIKAAVLPLFGNVPFALRDDAQIIKLLTAAGSRLAKKPRNTFLNGTFFGTIHPDFDATPFISWLSELRCLSGKDVLLSLIGRNGTAAEHLIRGLAALNPDGIEVVSLGEQPEVIISQALQFADFGVSTGSSHLLGKSGTCAAMREHGLPVMLPDGEVEVSFHDAVPPVHSFSAPESAMALLLHPRSMDGETGVSRTAAGFLELLHDPTSLQPALNKLAA